MQIGVNTKQHETYFAGATESRKHFRLLCVLIGLFQESIEIIHNAFIESLIRRHRPIFSACLSITFTFFQFE